MKRNLAISVIRSHFYNFIVQCPYATKEKSIVYWNKFITLILSPVCTWHYPEKTTGNYLVQFAHSTNKKWIIINEFERLKNFENNLSTHPCLQKIHWINLHNMRLKLLKSLERRFVILCFTVCCVWQRCDDDAISVPFTMK